jgi:uncharacterized protein YtpQ (UPF0354 family)
MRKLLLQAALFAAVAFSTAAFACDLTPRQLQKESLAILKKAYPDRSFSAGPEEDLIRMDKAELGLDNLYNKLCSESLSAKERAKHIQRHFENIVAMVQEHEAAQQPKTWDDAKEMVYLQLAPQSYLQPLIANTQLIHRPFTEGIFVAVVLDAADGYGYVRREDREKWQVSETELFDQAQRNLERSAREITLHEGRSTDKLLAIQENDGYDAARILVPSVRKHAAELLGEPFYLGIPHRDFIVMWSTANSLEFQRSTRDTLASDFATQPYSISGDVFEVWADGRIQRVK